MKKERLIAFTDAVLAIIMTILVLELEKPKAPTVAAIWALRQSYFAYALSFFWLGSLWVALNSLWERVTRISTAVIWWNLALLFFASFMPYATGLVSTYFTSQATQAFYGIIVIVTTLCNYFLHKALDVPNADNEALLAATAAYRKLLIPDIAIKVIGVFLAVTAYPPIMMYAVLIAAAYIMILHVRQERNHNDPV